MVSASEYYFKTIEREKRVKIPACLLNDEGIKAFDNAIATKNPAVISHFYRHFEKYFSSDPFVFISEKLAKVRTINEADKKLIQEIIKIKKEDPDFFFDFAGNLFYDAEKRQNSNLQIGDKPLLAS